MEEKKLYELLEQKEKEIVELKKLISDPKVQSKTELVDLNKYYSDKYELIHQQITKERLAKIADRITKIKLALSIIDEQEEAQRNYEKINSEIQAQIDALNTEMQNEYIKMEKMQFENKQSIDLLIGQRDEMILAQQAKWRSLETAIQQIRLGASAYFELHEEIAQLKHYSQNVGFAVIEKLKENEEKKAMLELELIEQKQASEEKLFELKAQVEELQQKFIKEAEINDDLNKEQLLNDLQREEIYLLELGDIFINMKKDHEFELQDLITKANLLMENKSQIDLKVDEFFFHCEAKLKETETEANKKQISEKIKSDFEDKIKEYKKLLKEKETLESDYHHLQGLYQNVRQKIKEIEEYVAKTNSVINNNSHYKQFFNELNSLKQKKLVLDNEQMRNREILEQYKNKRKIIVFDPFARNELTQLDEKIKVATKEYEVKHLSLLELEDKIKILKTSNQQLDSIISDKEKYEAGLPKFYQKMNELKQIIDLKHQELHAYHQQLENYSELASQLEPRQNENNN